MMLNAECDFTENTRILVLGATGWLGKTFCELLPTGMRVLKIAGSPRGDVFGWEFDRVREFQPTYIANFAFLTQNRLLEIGEDHFRDLNRTLTARFLDCLKIETVKGAITISSGAAVQRPQTLYGQLKLEEEESARASARSDQTIVIGRAFSLSGPHVRNPLEYAFSSFVLSARNSSIFVSAKQPTYRRYADAEDFLVTLSRALSAHVSITIESGGQLVEMRQLALEVQRLVNPTNVPTFAEHISEVPSRYHSDNSSWEEAISKFETYPLSLRDQIMKTNLGLIGT